VIFSGDRGRESDDLEGRCSNENCPSQCVLPRLTRICHTVLSRGAREALAPVPRNRGSARATSVALIVSGRRAIRRKPLEAVVPGLRPECRRPCKSFVKRKHTSPDARFLRSAQYRCCRTTGSHMCLSAMVPAMQNWTSIRCIGPEGRHRRLSLCSPPVPKQSEGASGDRSPSPSRHSAGPGGLRAV
jgi:hypothetical protein